MSKLALYKEGKTLFCKTHGWHEKWRVHTGNNVQCNKCSSDRQKVAREKEPIKFIFKDARQHAKAKNREFTITLDDLFNVLIKQDNKCSLTGVSFSAENKPSLDRIDSSKPYLKDNIKIVIFMYNVCKSEFSHEDVVIFCRALKENEDGKIQKSKLAA